MGKTSSAKQNKSARNPVYIDQDSAAGVKPPEIACLEKEINELYRRLLQFEKLFEETPSKEELAIPSDLAKDHELKQLLEEYEHNYYAFKNDLDIRKKQMVNQSGEDGYIYILKKDFITTLVNLPEINDRINLLDNKIRSRHEMIAPSKLSLISELQNYLIDAQDQLNKQFKLFAEEIASVELAAKDHPDSIFFQNELKTLCESLKNTLNEKTLNLDVKAKNNLIKRMLNHIGVGTIKKLDSEEISPFFKNLFATVKKEPEPTDAVSEATPTKLKQAILNGYTSTLNKFSKKPLTEDELLRKQIAATHHALSAIKDLPFKLYCVYFSKKNEELNLEKQISLLINNTNNFSNKWIENFESELLLFNDNYNDDSDISRGNLLLNRLLNLKSEFSDLKRPALESSTNEATAEERLALTEQNIKTLDNWRQKLQRVNDKILTNENDLQSTYKALQEKYKEERLQLKKSLDKKLQTAKDVLFITSCTAHNNEINEFHMLSSTLENEPAKPLAKFKKVTDESIKTLQGYIEEVKSEIIGLSTSLNEEIQSIHDAFQMPESLHEENLFKSELVELHKKLQTDTVDLKNHVENVKELSDDELPLWSDTFDILYSSAKEHTIKRGEIFIKARELEQRIRTISYQTSAGILTALNNEIARLTQTYINSALVSPGADTEMLQQLNEIQESCDFLLKNPYRPDLKKETLNAIDPRLNQLIKLREKFNELNGQYISKNLELMNDSKFHHELKEKVGQELHHDHMEIYSDAKRIKLIQWIRKHVLKPIVALQCQAGAYLKRHPEGNRYTFFITPGASTTERCIAETGHEAYKTLESVAAPAA